MKKSKRPPCGSNTPIDPTASWPAASFSGLTKNRPPADSVVFTGQGHDQRSAVEDATTIARLYFGDIPLTVSRQLGLSHVDVSRAHPDYSIINATFYVDVEFQASQLTDQYEPDGPPYVGI